MQLEDRLNLGQIVFFDMHMDKMIEKGKDPKKQTKRKYFLWLPKYMHGPTIILWSIFIQILEDH